MSDNLKKYIEGSREEFEFPFDEVAGWDQLRSLMGPRRRNPWIVYMGAGVAACFMFIAGWFSFMFYDATHTPVNAQTQEWIETEAYYQQEIGAKMAQVKSRMNDPRVLMEFEEMDEVLSSLKEDLKDNIDNEEVISAMMNSYRLKLKILERMLEDLEGRDKPKTSI